MTAQQVADRPAAPGPGAHQASFFRQSGFLMIANIAGGALMWAVHFLAKRIPSNEYGLFGTLLAVAMCIPAMPLQMVLAQQTAKALATQRERELAGMIRLAWLGTFLFWLMCAAVVVLMREPIMQRWGITNPAALWVTLLVVLFSVWLPMFSGVLQGAQKFFWLGSVLTLNAVGRVAVAALAVVLLGAFATGMMAGVLAGLAVGVVIAAWQSRKLWTGPSRSFEWRPLMAQVIPLLFGFGAFQFLFTADTMFVKAYFSGEDTGFYFSAGTLSRALMWLVGPLAAVMFPRIVHSSAKSEKSDLMGLVLLGTGILAVCGALGLWVLGPFVVKLVYRADYVTVAASLLPWYAWAMVPLALANVLLNSLLARGLFRIVPGLVVLAVAYGFALTQFHDSLITVLKVLGVFSLLLLALCAWFTHFSPPSKSPLPASG